jgi:hypothetical protein
VAAGEPHAMPELGFGHGEPGQRRPSANGPLTPRRGSAPTRNAKASVPARCNCYVCPENAPMVDASTVATRCAHGHWPLDEPLFNGERAGRPSSGRPARGVTLAFSSSSYLVAT